MDNYIFSHNQNKNKACELITMTRFTSDGIECKDLGNIYNLVDYINSSNFYNSTLTFQNFKGNQIKFVIMAITKYKNIDSVKTYDTIIVSNRKRKIRGR